MKKEEVQNKGKPVRGTDSGTDMFRINKTELVWPGKYNEDGTLKEVPRVNLPFQVIETINESRVAREAKNAPQLSLFDVYEGKEGDTFEAGWKNKLIWGDNLLVMGSLLEKFAGKIDLIYIDPPFATGADFSFVTRVGENNSPVEKDQSALEEKAYRDTWGRGLDSYLQMVYERILFLRDLLNEKGSIYIHLGPNISHYVKPILDNVFSPGNFRNEIIWKRTYAHSDAKQYGVIHDSLLFYTKTETWFWNVLRGEPDKEYIETFFDQVEKESGRRYARVDLTAAGTTKEGASGKPWRGVNPSLNGRHWAFHPDTLDKFEKEGRIHWPKNGMPRLKRYEDEFEGVTLQDIWTDIRKIHNQSAELLGYATQKPEALLKRIIKASSNEGCLVADFFCGSGTTLAVAEKLGRRWIGCDMSRFAIHTTRKRLLGLEKCKPFEVLNLGKYERKYWIGVTFGDKRKDDQQMLIYQYMAFMLKLCSAEPLTGLQHIHGKKGHALIHIGAVDAPVTIDEVNASIEECLAVKQTELHVLGWEWEMGMTPFIVQEARKRGIKLLLLTIPREVMEEQAVDKGDIKFFEVAHLEVEINNEKSRKVTISLSDFAFPYADLVCRTRSVKRLKNGPII